MNHLFGIGRLIYHTSLILSRNFQKNLDPFDITIEQWGVLNILYLEDGKTLKELAEKSYKDHTNITRIVDKLEKKDLIRRSSHPEDRRSYLIYVTAKGKQLRAEILPIVEQVIDSDLRGINLEEQQILKDLLVRICKNVEEKFF